MENYFFTIIIIFLSVNSLFLIWLILGRNKKNEMTINLKPSKNNIKEISNLIISGIGPVIDEANQKIQQFSEDFINEYKEKTDGLVKKLIDESSKTIEQFSTGGNQFCSKAESFTQALEQEFDKVQKIISGSRIKLQKAGENAIAEEISKIAQEHKEIKEFLLSEAEKEIKNAGEQLLKRLSPAHEEAIKNIENNIALTKKEIEDYKQERMRQLDKQIYEKLGKIAKETFGKVINLAEHEKLIQEALEKAKREIF